MNPLKQEDIVNYKIAGDICQNAYNNLKNMVYVDNILDIKTLCNATDKFIIDSGKLKTVKTSKESLFLAFPTCISINNCVGYYRYDSKCEEYNTIKLSDIVKVEFGVNINGAIFIFGDTFVFNDNKYDDYLILLDNLEKHVLKLLKPGYLNDDIRIKIESMCTEKNCFPLENTTSYQSFLKHLKTQESKYIITNYKTYYDEDDNLIVEPNTCFEFLENEIYNINLTFVLDNEESDNKNEHYFKELCETKIYAYNDFYYGFKLKSSKDFYNMIKSTHLNNAFDITQYNTTSKNRIGIKESYDNGILNDYPIYYSKDGLPVFHKKFAVIVTKKGGVKLVS